MPIRLGPIRTEPALSRRRALATMALGGTAIAAGCGRNAGSRGNPGGWYALFSDPHIAADPSARLRGETMADNLRAVVTDILHADDRPHGVVVDGDLAFHHGDPGDYRTFLDVVSPLTRESLTLHLTLGNHDDRANIREAVAAVRGRQDVRLEGDPTFAHGSDADSRRLLRGPCGQETPFFGPEPGKAASAFSGRGIRFLLLDSQNGVNVTAGRLGEEQLAWLACDLDRHPRMPAVVFVHHNINARSESALTDTEALLDVLRPRRQAKAVFFGHTHVWNVRQIDGIHMVNLPAVGYRFLPKQPLGWVAFRPHDDGAEIELRCIGGDRRQDGRRTELRWRPS